MKAVVYDRYGTADELRLVDIPTPAPAPGQVLIKIHAVSVNGSDTEGLTGKPLYARMRGLLRPAVGSILGSDVAGRVEAVGDGHSDFRVGDAVFGELPGYQGGFAEYACARGKTLALKPAGLSFAQAAAIPQGGVIALQGIREQGRVQAGQRVLINGGGGSAGTFAIQIARRLGAEVTGVDNGYKLDFMRSLGADRVLDYREADFTRNGRQYDLILDLVAHHSALASQRAVAPGGAYLFVGGSAGVLLQILLFGELVRRRTGKHLRILSVSPSRASLLAVTDLVLSGEIRPVIDREYPLTETREAMRYILAGRAKGKVVLTVAGED